MVNVVDLIDDVDGCEERRAILVRASSAAGCCVVCRSKKVIPGHAEALISDRIPKFVVSRPIPSYGQGNNEKVR